MNTLNYFDVHSHLNFADYGTETDQVLARMKEKGVWTITVGVDLKTSGESIALAEAHEGIFASVGLHPHDNLAEVFDFDAYKKLALHPKVVAIGECGLDYSRLSKVPAEAEAEKIRQKSIFAQQILLANEVGKPLMLHIRDPRGSYQAYDDAYEMLVREAKVKGNVHFFAGNVEVAKKFIELGFTLSFTGVITFTCDYDEVVKFAPKDMILSETDAPFVAPAPYRGKRNEPTYVIEVARKIAQLRGETEQEMAEQLVKNAQRVFGLVER